MDNALYFPNLHRHGEDFARNVVSKLLIWFEVIDAKTCNAGGRVAAAPRPRHSLLAFIYGSVSVQM
jgi:hypothetical protein